MEQLVSDFGKHAVGPTGGLFMVGIVLGGWGALKWIAPRMYEPRILALEENVEALQREIRPYREWSASNLPAAVSATKYQGSKI